MATLEENVNRVIEDFDNIETAIKNKGVEVPDGTDTSQYATLISEIPVGADVDIVQDTGESTTSVMSQDAVTKELKNLSNTISDNTKEIDKLKNLIGSIPEEDTGDVSLVDYIQTEVLDDVKDYVTEQLSTQSLDGGEL